MKKIIFTILTLAVLATAVLFLRGDENTWTCESGEWTKHGNPSTEKPDTPCGIEDDLNVFDFLADSCEINNGGWLSEQKECEQVDKTWCDGNQGIYSECESGCRHNNDPLVACTAQCVGVCKFSNLPIIEVVDFNSCVEAGNAIMESYPRQCQDQQSVEVFTEDVGNVLEVLDLIQLSTPLPGEEISSPLVIKGQARGTWFFEASFPVILVNWDGLIIAEGVATATDDWMTEEFVPFTANLEFIKPDYSNRGALILKKDNPSDLPEYDNALEIPILFK